VKQFAAVVLLWSAVLSLAGLAVAQVQAPYQAPKLSLRVGFGGNVSYVAANGGIVTQLPNFSCPAAKGSAVVVPPTLDANNNPFCIVATLAGLNVAFQTTLPFVTPKSLSCTELSARASNTARDTISVEARIGRTIGRKTVYDGARAKCDIDFGFAYALSVETQSIGAGADQRNIGIVRAGQNEIRTLVIPWALLHLGRHAQSLLLNVNVCGGISACKPDLTQFVVPLDVVEGSASLGVANDPYVRLETPSPKPGSTPFRVHDVEADASLNWDRHDILSATFAQDESYVASQRALSQALSLAPLSLPVTAPTISVLQNLQTQSQTLFAFQMPSDYLEDPSLKPLFDVLPFAVTRIGSLSSGYAYGYTSDQFKTGVFYGSQARGWYSGGGTVTVALATPTPTPNPSPTPTPVNINQTAAGPPFSPLRPPPPPAPFFESGTSSVPPLLLTYTDAFTGSKGTRDDVDAVAIQGHVYANQSQGADYYQAETVNIYGRFESDFEFPVQVARSVLSQFFGESSTYTTAITTSHPEFFQVRETIGQQQNDNFFSPGIGTTTWLTPLSGPVGHVTVSYASGTQARFTSLDLIGFRLTNTTGDVATQEGWQVSIPPGNFFHTPGWLLTGGSETQTASDRIAALEQGLLPNYATAVAEVAPTPGPGLPFPTPAIHAQRLGNALLLSPWLGNDLQLSFSSGYDFGTVTGCGSTTTKKKPKKTYYECETEMDDRGVGGLFLNSGRFGVGATDTSTMQGNATAGSAARNLGTAGALPGSTTSYLTYSGCPAISAAFTNAAFASGVPLPQQGITLSGVVDYPIVVGPAQMDINIGYFNERAVVNAAFNESGVFAMLKLSTAFQKAHASCS
jgi:hypothetical protein